MSYNVSNSSAKAGLCPHGLPAGACPICSGGGGGIKKTDRNTRRHAGEMTWNECYAQWQRMKNEKAHKALLLQEQHKLNMQKSAEKFSKIISDIINFPPLKPVKAVAEKVSSSLQKVFGTLSKTLPRITNFVKEKFVDISDKIAAMLGEEKLAKLKNLKDFTKRSFEKIFSLFGFIDKSQEEEETSEEVKKEEKKISFWQKVKRKFENSEDKTKQ